MQKMTKYQAAINAALNARLPAIETRNRAELYDLLAQAGLTWCASAGRWGQLVEVRVMAQAGQVEAAADQLAEAVGWPVVERSRARRCRRPREAEARVYLKFFWRGW